MGQQDSSSERPAVCSVWGEHELAAFDRAVIDNSQNAVVACDEHGNLVVFNPTAREWYGVDVRELPTNDQSARYGLFREDGVTPLPEDELPLARAFQGEVVRNLPLTICAKGQPPRRVSCGGGPFFDEQGRKIGAFVVMVDTTDVHHLTRELEHMASHDVLTGLPNRRTFETEVERATSFACRGVVSTVLFADVDRFKTCNDRFGHEFGDTVLRAIAERMRNVVREVDTVARIGGDEFGIVLWDKSGPSVDLVAERLADAVAAEGLVHDLDIGLSIGSAIITSESDASTVLADADNRMYRVKASGGHGSAHDEGDRSACEADGHGDEARGVRPNASIDARALSYVKLRLLGLVLTEGLQPMLRSMLDEVCGITGSKIGFYHTVDPDQESLTLQAWSTRTMKEFCTAEPTVAHYPVANAGVWADAIRERAPIIHNDYASLPTRQGLPEGHAPVIRELVVPVIRDDLVVAILGVGNKSTDYLKTDSDAVLLLADVAWDMVERKLAEEQLIESEQRLQAVIENAPFGAHMYELTDDDRLVFIDYNRRAEEMIDVDHARLVGMTLEQAFPGNVGTETPEQYRRVAREQTTWESQALSYDDGDIAGVFEILAFPSGPNRLAVFFRDITEKHRFDLALERGEIRYRRLITNMRDGFAYCRLVFDDEGSPVDWEFLDANDRVDRQMPGAHLTGKRALQVWPHVREQVPELFSACCQAGVTGESQEFDVEVSPGAWVHYFVSSPEANHFVMVGSNATARRRAEDGLARTTRALTALSGVNEALVRAESEDQLLLAVCEAVVRDAGYALAWVGYAQNDEGLTVTPVRHCGPDSGFLETAAFSWGEGPLGQGPTGRSIREAKPFVMREMQTDPSYAPWRDEALSRGFQASVSLPLVAEDGAAFGALVIYSADRESFDGEEMSLLSKLAKDLSFGIGNLRARQQHAETGRDLVEANERLEGVLMSVTEAMGKAVEARDPYTQGHEQGVATVAMLIATEMGLSSDEVDGIEVAALVHDVGKLAVPTEILSKPGKLSDPELELIKVHSQAGYDILKDIDFAWPVADIVLQHHERMDGSGYPNGSSGADLLMGARVLMVADVLEAMAAHRPYRPALGLAAAMDEIKGHPEKFDQDVVSACVRLYESGRIDL